VFALEVTMRPLLFLPFLAACGGLGPTQGELGKTGFAYDTGVFGCYSGCSATDSMAARSSAGLWITDPEKLPAGFTVKSSNDEVLTFELGGTKTTNKDTWRGVSATSHAAGDAKLILVDADGQELDRLMLHVKDVKKVEVEDRDKFKKTLTLMEGGAVSLDLTLRDAAGAKLRGNGGVDYAFSGSVAAPAVSLSTVLSGLLTALFAGTSKEYVEVKANAVGTGTISVTSQAGASLDVPIAVVGPDAVTKVTVAGESSPDLNESFYVNAHAFAGDEEVFSPKCQWALDPADGPVKVTSSTGSSITIQTASAATVSVRCEIGSQSASVSVSFR
jgi:hypothetical protein